MHHVDHSCQHLLEPDVWLFVEYFEGKLGIENTLNVDSKLVVK